VSVQQKLAAAEKLLPGHAAPDGERDPRWQAIIKVGYHIETDPEAIWPFVLRWGSHDDEDLRTAIATCLLEHLLEYHFDSIFPHVEAAARSNRNFADTVCRCWKLGQAEEPTRARRFDRLVASIRRSH
jgi:hypothetical protein